LGKNENGALGKRLGANQCRQTSADDFAASTFNGHKSEVK